MLQFHKRKGIPEKQERFFSYASPYSYIKALRNPTMSKEEGSVNFTTLPSDLKEKELSLRFFISLRHFDELRIQNRASLRTQE